MGQWIAIQSALADEAAGLSERALAAFWLLHSLKPADHVIAGMCRAFTFSPKLSPSIPIEWNKDIGEWSGVAGTMFYRDSGNREALRAFMMTDLERGVQELDGTFSIVRGSNDGNVAIITDRLGSMHVYIATLGSAVVITTSSMVLAALSDASWDLISCREFLATGTVFGQRTLFQGIEKLAPASVFQFRNGSLKSHYGYWKIADIAYDSDGITYPVEQLAGALVRTLRAVASAYARPVLDLTGGLDSRAVLAAAMKSGARFETVVCGAESNADVRVAGLIAREYGLSHHRLETEGATTIEDARSALKLTDGEFDAFEYSRIARVHSQLAQRYQVSVNGSNGEIGKGYWWELLYPFIGSSDWFPDRRVARGRFAFAPEPDLLAARFETDLVTHFAELIRQANEPLAGYPNTVKMDNTYLTLRMQRWQGRIASATNRIWPATAPFTFRGPMEVALSAAPSRRVRNRLARRLIEYFDPKLASFPLDNGLPALPLRVGTMPRFLRGLAGKRIFSASLPATSGVSVWEDIRDMLLSPALATTELYRPGALNALVERAWGGPVVGSVSGRAATLELLGQAIQAYRIRARSTAEAFAGAQLWENKQAVDRCGC